MKKMLLVLILAVAVSACGSSNDGSGSGEKYPPARDTISGVVYLDDNHAAIPEGAKDSIYSLFYYAPADKYTPDINEDNLPQIDFVASSSGIFGGQLRISAKDYKKTQPKDAHTLMLERGYEQLKSGLMQNDASSNTRARVGRKDFVGSVFKDIKIDIEDGNPKTIDAICVYESEHAYIYWQNDIAETPNFAAEMKEYGDSFDKIYGIIHEYFGEENDTDGNGKVIILFIEKIGDGGRIIGFFNSDDKYPKSSFPKSNEADMFYMGMDFLDEKETILATLAHEFQHMTLFDTRYNINSEFKDNDVWLNEGLSKLSEYYVGYFQSSHDAHINDFLRGRYSKLSLTSWSSYNYGYSSMYLHYLNDRFGSGMIKKIYSMGFTGVKAVEHSVEMDFNDIFHDFTLAVALSGSGVTDNPKYNFKNIDVPAYSADKHRPGLQPVDDTVFDAKTDYTGKLPAYSIRWLRWDPKIADFNILLTQEGMKFDGFILTYDGKKTESN